MTAPGTLYATAADMHDTQKMKFKERNDHQFVQELQSPLTALQLLAHSDEEMSSRSKKLVDDAIHRIRTIANQHVLSTLQDERELGEALSNGGGRVHALSEILEMMERVFENKKTQYRQSKRIQFFSACAVDRALPIELEVNGEDFYLLISSALDQAVEALGGGEGVVRLGLHPGLHHVQVTIEDNGRGMSDELLSRVQQKGLVRSNQESGERLTFTQIAALVTFWGGRIERRARLGVGSRVMIEIPRVDAFASPFAGARKTRTAPEQNSALL